MTWRYLSPIEPFSLMSKVESTGSGSMLLLSARSSTAIGWPEAVRAGSMLVDETDERAAGHVDLGVLGQLGGVPHVDVERVARHERESVVGVVGQEHRDDRDEHGHRADQHRARDPAALATARAHRPLPIR